MPPPIDTINLRDCPARPGYFIYALVDPRTDEIRYIGKAQGYLNSRLKGHIYEAKSGKRVTHKLSWIRQLLDAGLAPVPKVVAQFVRGDTLANAEREWIARMRADGVRLVNATDGGEGMPNPSPETRAKLRGRGCTFTEEQRAKGRAIRMANAASPERRARRAENEAEAYRRKCRRIAELGPEGYATWKVENARRMAAARVERERARGVSKTEEHRAKLSAAALKAVAENRHPTFKGQTHTEETRAKMRAAWVKRKPTHCPQGHERTVDNLRKQGKAMVCRICSTARSAACNVAARKRSE